MVVKGCWEKKFSHLAERKLTRSKKRNNDESGEPNND